MLYVGVRRKQVVVKANAVVWSNEPCCVCKVHVMYIHVVVNNLLLYKASVKQGVSGIQRPWACFGHFSSMLQGMLQNVF